MRDRVQLVCLETTTSPKNTFDKIGAPDAAYAADLADRILSHEPDVVGFSCFLWNVRKILLTCRRLKELEPSIPIVLGGPEVSPVSAKILAENPWVDVVVNGEGELVFAELLDHYAAGKGALENIPGLTCRKDGKILQTLPAPLPDLAQLPSPYLIGMPETDRMFRWALVEGSRGCPFDCKYCDQRTNQRIRWYPLDRVIKEMEYLAPRAGGIILCDSDPLMDRVRTREILRAFNALSKRHPVMFHFSTNPIFLDEESMALLNSSQFYIGFGVQTVDENILTRITRPHNQPKADAKMDRLKQLAPRMRDAIFMMYASPGDTLESFKESLEWELSKCPAWPLESHTLILPGAGMGRQPEKYGLEFEKDPPYRVLSTPTMPFADIVEASRIASYVRVFVGEVYLQQALYGLGRILTGREPRPFLSAFGGFFEFLCERGIEPFVGLKRTNKLEDPSLLNGSVLFDERPQDDLLVLGMEYLHARLGVVDAGAAAAELTGLLRCGLRRNEMSRHTQEQREALRGALRREGVGRGSRVLLVGSGVARMAKELREEFGVDLVAVEWELCSYVDVGMMMDRRVFLWGPEELMEAPWEEGGFDAVVLGLVNPNRRDMPFRRFSRWAERQVRAGGRLFVFDGTDRTPGQTALFTLDPEVPGAWKSLEAAGCAPGEDVGPRAEGGWRLRVDVFRKSGVSSAPESGPGEGPTARGTRSLAGTAGGLP